MAGRDPDVIKQEIDHARERLASTVDSLTERASPRRLANEAKARLVALGKKPAVTVVVAGLGALTVVLVIHRIRNR